MPKKHIWITYSWKDNEQQDVDFIAQKLRSAGLEVHLDKWDLVAGRHLWDQIDKAIASTDKCDAWLIVATENSLASDACREELAYALNQAISVRGLSFPVIALFQGPVDTAILPQALGTRRCVSCLETDWVETVVAATEGRTATVRDQPVEEFALQVHELATTRFASGPYKYAIEVRPRAGMWAPFIAAVPIGERDAIGVDISRGPKGTPTPNLMKSGPPAHQIGDWWCEIANEEASPIHSYYVWCKVLPTKLRFGVPREGAPQFTVDFFVRGSV